MRRFARRECAADPEASLETSLHPPLTLPRQPRDQPPVMEQPVIRQPRLAAPAAAAPQLAAVQEGSAAPAATQATAIKADSAAVQPAEQPTPLRSQQPPVEDLYGDLDLQARSLAAAHRGTGPAAVPQPLPQPGMAGHRQEHGAKQASIQPAMQLPAAEAARRAASGVANQQQTDAAAGDLKALLSNPAALQALLKDPAQLQRLLEKHPALISILKNTLGHK